MRGRALAVVVLLCAGGCSLVFDPDAFEFGDGGGAAADGGVDSGMDGATDSAAGDVGGGDGGMVDGGLPDGGDISACDAGPVDAGAVRAELRSDLVVEYRFDECDGTEVRDTAERPLGPPVHLVIEPHASHQWHRSRLCIEPDGGDLEPPMHSAGVPMKVHQALASSDGSFSVELWVEPTALAERKQVRIFSIATSPAPDMGNVAVAQGAGPSCGEGPDPQHFCYRLGAPMDMDFDWTEFFGTTVQLRQTYHLVVVRECVPGCSVRTYVDGEPVGDPKEDPDNVWLPDARLALGGEHNIMDDNPRHWTGCYDYVAFYDRASEQSEIEGLFEEGPL